MIRGAATVMTVVVTVLLATPARAQSALSAPSVEDATAPFNGDDLLFMEVTANGYQLAETMNVYVSRSGIYVPLGEFSRIVDFAVGVFPSEGRAEGWVMSRDNALVIDLGRGVARIGGVDMPIHSSQARMYQDDLYVRADLLERLLPLKLKADVRAQTLVVIPTTPLPFEQRLAREQRQASVSAVSPTRHYRMIANPYVLAGPPAFDVNIGGQVTRDGQDQSRNFDARVAGDLLWSSFQGFVGSDAEANVTSARVLFERKDPEGHALGSLGGVRVGAGDVYTPTMAIGAASFLGRGVYYTTAPLESLDLATPLNLRGELPLGEEVELYVNEVLQPRQTSPVQGRYQFLNVPLTVGLNTLRLVFYGTQGQTHEQVRRINFGAGQIEAGQFVFRMGAVEQNQPLIQIGPARTGSSIGAGRFIAAFDYGVSPTLTVSGGAARYRPFGAEARTLGMIGLHGSIGGLAAQLDIAMDDAKGTGASLGVAGRPMGVSIVGRHAEYAGGFVDETRFFGFDNVAPLLRSSEIRADTVLRPASGLILPMSVTAQRQERTNGSGRIAADLRTSTALGRYYLSGSLAYEDSWTVLRHQRDLVGAMDVATLVAARAQFRGGLTWRFTPRNDIESAYATVDYQITSRNTARFAMSRSLGLRSKTIFQASSLYAADRFDMSFNAAYETDTGDWRLGLQLGFGIGLNPATGRYDISRPGVSSGGSAAINAYIDANGDGLRQPDEEGVSKVVVETSNGAPVTDADGHAFAVGFGDGAAVRASVDLTGIDDPFLIGGEDVQFVPRPGRTAMINVPLQTTGEVQITARIHRQDAPDRSIAALNLELVSVAGDVITGRTDHAGTVVLEGVRPGRYALRLDPAQAGSLGLAMMQAVSITVPPTGGFVRADDVLIVLTSRDKDRP